jgi:hypothetical protein
MRVKSSIQCGYRADGSALLSVGENDLDEAKLTESERMLIDELRKVGMVEDVVEPSPRTESKASLIPDDDFDETDPIVDAVSEPIVTAAQARAATRRRK